MNKEDYRNRIVHVIEEMLKEEVLDVLAEGYTIAKWNRGEQNVR